MCMIYVWYIWWLYQWPWLRNRLIGGTYHIVLTYSLGLCKGIYPQSMAENVVQCLHFRILKFPLIRVYGENQFWHSYIINGWAVITHMFDHPCRLKTQGKVFFSHQKKWQFWMCMPIRIIVSSSKAAKMSTEKLPTCWQLAWCAGTTTSTWIPGR